jgi:hypothetical protein
VVGARHRRNRRAARPRRRDCATPPRDGDARRHTPAAGDSITADDVSAALDALEALDSWKFTSTYWTGYAGNGTEQSVQGTERRKPDKATDAAHHSASGDLHYTRIGDDIWQTWARLTSSITTTPPPRPT